ncbi:major antigen-like [Uloborus diversus]|uniref:major antigen-like n=1 Tax=Uloborus diversus TaxID=327109 RepID=UPI002409F0D3|nr:major antigen-like [Uloborus diversus]
MSRDRKSKWKCEDCSDSVKAASADTNAETPLTIEMIRDEIKSCFRSFEGQFLRELKPIKEEIGELKKSLDFCNKSSEEMNSKLIGIVDEIKQVREENRKLVLENRTLNDKIESIERELDAIELRSKENNIEINNYPEEKDENLNDIIGKMATELHLEEKGEIINMHRVPTQSKNRIKPIIVRFKDILTRNTLLRATKDNKNLTTTMINNKFEEQKIFINEHVTRKVKELHFIARKFKSENDYKFVWMKGGKVFLRKSENDRVIQVRRKEDLDKLRNNSNQFLCDGRPRY